MNEDSKIYVAGSGGMVGSAIVRQLQSLGYKHILQPSSRELDLRRQQAVEDFFRQESPEFVFLAAAKVGGILANNEQRATFLYDNLIIEANVIHAAYEAGVKKLLFLGSSCIYPKMAPQPLREEYLLTGPLESTNEPYAVAKIAGIKLCETYRDQYGCDFIAAMPTNLYGPGDNYDLGRSHVLPALIRKFHAAKMGGESSVVLWGSGAPLREFLHVDDLAQACVFLMNNYSDALFINAGSGEEVTIRELAEMVRAVVGFEGSIEWDKSKPDGTPRKLMDNSRIHGLGWHHSIAIAEGVRRTYENFLSEYSRGALREVA